MAFAANSSMLTAVSSPLGETSTTAMPSRAVSVRPIAKVCIKESVWLITSGLIVSSLVFVFSLYFPFILAPWAARETYQYAYFDYDPKRSFFDNSFYTYGTDYILAIIMAGLAMSISLKNDMTHTLAWRTRCLLFLYSISTIAGGIAHQNYLTVESRNTYHFRILWTICVGSVAASSGFMGSIGTELVRLDRDRGVVFWWMPLLTSRFWGGFAALSTLFVMAGYCSFQRPACDIFVPGITQAPSSFYMMIILGTGLPTEPVQTWARIAGNIGFLWNAPLLPMYPLLIQYTDLDLSVVNVILHTWLLIGWGLQGLSLRHVEQVLTQSQQPPQAAVPVVKKPKKL